MKVAVTIETRKVETVDPPHLRLNPLDICAAGFVSGELLYVQQRYGLQRRPTAAVIASLSPALHIKPKHGALSIPKASTVLNNDLQHDCVVRRLDSFPVAASVSIQLMLINGCRTLAGGNVLSHLKSAIMGTILGAGTYFRCSIACGGELMAQTISISTSTRTRGLDASDIAAMVGPKTRISISSNMGLCPKNLPNFKNRWFPRSVELAGSIFAGELNASGEELQLLSADRGQLSCMPLGTFQLDCLQAVAFCMVDRKVADAELSKIRNQIASTSQPILLLHRFAVRALCSKRASGQARRASETFWNFFDSLPQRCPAVVVDSSVDVQLNGVSMWKQDRVEFRSLELHKRATFFAEMYANLTALQKHGLRKVCQLRRKIKVQSFAHARHQVRLDYFAGLKNTLHALDCRLSLIETASSLRHSTSGIWNDCRLSKIMVPDTNWDDIGGLRHIKRALKATLQQPQLMSMLNSCLRLGQPRGILLFGPPGCSKTMIARAIATESGNYFINVKGPELLSKWLGESERAVRALFYRAKAHAPCIVFFDEVEALTARRSEPFDLAAVESTATDRVLSQILAEFDGIQDQGDILVVGATNRPDLMDSALLRPGRMDQLIYVPPPDMHSYGEILCLALMYTPTHRDLNAAQVQEVISARATLFSGADLSGIARRATILALEGHAKCVCLHHLEHALSLSCPSIDQAMVSFYENWPQLSHSK